jgi:hypothetical protein
MPTLDDFIASVEGLIGVTPEMLSRRAALRAEVGMEAYKRRIGAWIAALEATAKPDEPLSRAAIRCASCLKDLSYPQGEAWVLAAFVELRSLKGIDPEAASC